MQPPHRCKQPHVRGVDPVAFLGQRDPHGQIGQVGQELVQGRVEQPDRRRQRQMCIRDSFSFGTNDLTQTTWGFSRDDVEATLFAAYLEKGVFTCLLYTSPSPRD